jgi:site-specific recombinase XerD
MDINQKYQIFISSTFTDLKVARAKVTEKILTMYHFPIGMEMFSAGNDDQWTVIKRTIDISDYYVIIVGHRYGSTTEDGISYTEKEYDYARAKGIPILAFIKDRDAPTTPSERENEPIKQAKLDDFVNKAMSSKMCDFWVTEEELAAKVSIALMKEFINNPRIGWVRADRLDIPSNLIKDTNLEYQINKYIEDKERQGLNKRTLYSYKMQLKLFLEYSKEKTILEIDTQHIKDYLIYREDNFGIKAKSTMETLRTNLKVFFDWLVEENIIERNPVRKVNTYIVEEVVVEALNLAEIKEIQNACETLRDRALIEVLLSTGCKLGELGNIKLENIDWVNNTITLETPNRNRVVILSNNAKESLMMYLNMREDKTDFLFVSERKPYRKLSSRGIQREISNIASKTNIRKKVSPRVFRHTFAKIMLEKGTPMHIVQSLLGHKDYRSTSETYVKITNDNIKSILKFDF